MKEVRGMETYKYDVVSEAVLEATPAEIIAAYGDEFAGRSSWWLPYLRARVRDQVEYPQVGAVLDVQVSVRPGGVDRRDATTFTERVTAYEPQHRIVVTTDGALRGEAETTLTPIDDTHTRIHEHWRANPAGLWGLLLRFMDVEAHQRTVTRAGFQGIGEYIAAKRATSA
jgi:uncharacterized protein YndB with AHSA1/START domain